MAHEIATIADRPAIAYLGETPWHKLGTPLTDDQSRDIPQVMQLAGLDWTVRTESVFLQDGRVNPFSLAIVRESDQTILGSVGPQTEVAQNAEAFSIIEPLVVVAGALGRGERVWALVDMGQAIEPVPGDRSDGYLLLRHAHDNSHVLEGIPTTIRVVCANTSRAAVMAAGGEDVERGRIFRIRKTAGVKDRIEEARQLVRRLGQTFRETGETFASMASTRVDPQVLVKTIEQIFPYPIRDRKEMDSHVITERRKAVFDAVFTSPGSFLAGARTDGTATPYALFNAVTWYFDHVRPGQAIKDSAKAKAAESALFGGNDAVKLLALAKARQLVAA